MTSRSRDFVRAILPAFAMALCHGCGGSSGATSGEVGTGASLAANPSPAATQNSAPTISADAPAYARVGTAYDFAPSSNDGDGDALHFTADNLPPWASINATTGHITGTPQADDVGVYESITIKVADATHTVSTQPFDITVIGAAGGMATLHWETPLSKVDGSPLDDLAGYRIVYGRNPDDLDESVFIDDPTATSYEFEDLDSGVWYFAVIGIDAGGLEGPPTTTASKSI